MGFIPVAILTFIIFLKELELKGTAAYTEGFDISMNLLAKHKIDAKYISDTVGFTGFKKALNA